MKRLIRLLLAGVLLPLATSCSRQQQADTASPTPSAASAAPKLIEACSLLTAQELETVQGEPLQSTKPSGQVHDAIWTAQCYFELATQSNSIVLTVTQPADASSQAEVKKSWQQMFHKPPAPEGEAVKKKEPPRKVEGVGDDAFWAGNDQLGALYVLKGERSFRISVGGGGGAGEKLEKSKRLAGFVLGRF